MRILICASEAPLPPVNGFRVLLRALTKELRQEHELRVLAFRSPDQHVDREERNDLRLLPQPVSRFPGSIAQTAQAFMAGRPLRAGRLAEPMAGALREELRAFLPDIVHVTSGRLAGLASSLAGQPAVLGALDAMHLNVEARALVASGLRRRLLRVEAGRVRRFEATQYRAFDRIVVVSDADRAALHEVDPSLDIRVIPNGVDADLFSPDPRATVDSRRIVFTGVMSYAPNVLAAEFLAREIFPRVRREWPEARLVIVGRSPSPRVLALRDLPSIEVTGEVPDLRVAIREGRVFACPMTSGTGIKNKLLEAMACGVPCVVTPLALQGLDVSAGEHLLVGADAEELADHIVSVLVDDDLATRLGAAARQYVCSGHDWSAVARAYLSVWADAKAASS